MKKTVFLIAFALVIILFGVFAIRWLIGGSEDTWICDHGQWVKHGHPSAAQPNWSCRGTSTNTNRNDNTNVMAVACALITDAQACRQRADCLAIDYCSCTTDGERADKCGGTDTGCLCEMGGFVRCEALDCSVANTNTLPAAEADCLAQGGEWGRIGLSSDERCNLPAADANKNCTSGDDCEAGWCLASDDQLLANIDAALTGRCPDHQSVAGCLRIVEGGRLSMVCID